MNNSSQWQGQTAIITGGADGLGLASARRLASYGVQIALFDRDADKLAAVCDGIKGARGFCVDITDAVAVERAVNEWHAETGRVDILINCAGITGQTNIPSHQVNLDDYDRVMNINARGSLVTSQAVLPLMLERGYGRILHVASIAGKEGNAGMVAYSMSKAAVIALAKVQGKEVAQSGVTVNAIVPAVIRTELVAAMPPEQVKYMTDKIPMKRCGLPAEFAALATFIVSPEAAFSTGATFDLTGGRATY